MKCKQTLPGKRAGAAAVEFAIVMIVLVPLLLGVWEVGRLVNAQQLVMSAAREGGRHASTALKSNTDVQNTVLAYLKNAGLTNITQVATSESDLKASSGKVFVQIKIYDTAGNEKVDLDAKKAEQNYKVEVLVSIMFKDVKYSPTNAFLTTDAQVASRVYWRSMKDVPVTVNNTIPLN